MKMSSAKPFKLMNLFNNKGFTLVEMILAFSIFLIIVSFIPISISMLYQNGLVDERLQKMEWEVFIAQVKKEVRISDRINVDNNKLYLAKDGQTIVYESYGSNIRRKVDLKGHEIMLQNVKTVTFEKIVRGVKISVQDLYNQSETSMIRSFISEDSYNAP
jgi:competence protein ComGF